MDILRMVFGVFALIGMLDKIFGNKFKLGDEFEKGILATGALALAMVGLMVMAPTISNVLIPVLGPVSKVLHIDPSFIGAFIANDMGGASVCQQLSPGTVWGGYNGLIVASMLGILISFALPVPLKMIDKKYHKHVLSGILCGISTMPVGCIVGGLMVGCPFFTLLLNTSPAILVAVVTCVGLVLNADLCRKIFGVIGNVILIVMTIGLGAGVFAYITGIKLIPYMDSIESAFASVAGIAIILAGVYPLIAVVSRLFKKPLTAFGKVMKINDISVVGLISTLANAIPTISLVDKMNPKGIVMNMAFIVSSAFVFGDHLAFTMSYDESYVAGMVVGKLVSGISSLVVAHFMFKHTEKTNSVEENNN